MKDRFTLIGLPGVGKSTVTKKCADILNSQGVICDIKSTDEIIRGRFKQDDPVILKFETSKGVKIPGNVFEPKKGTRPTTAFIEEFGEEPMFRDLEEMFVNDIIQTSTIDACFDLGGKAPLRSAVVDTLKENHIPPIFLYADHEMVASRLASDDNWKKRSNYLLAGENGWEKLAKKHREERLSKYINIAPIIISVGLQTPEQLAKEILYRINELKQACSERNNEYTTKSRPFLDPNTPKPLAFGKLSFRPSITAIACPESEDKSEPCEPKYRMIISQ
jgi:shikimate kinase